MKIDTIVFDLGGVLIDWNPKYLFRKIFETESEVDHFLENVCKYEWNVEQDAGRSLADGTEYLVALHPDWEKEIRAYYGRWEEMLGGEIAETVEILESLKYGGYRILALTNWSSETFPIAHQRYDFFKHIEGIVVSGDEKLAKPDPKIYQTLIKRYEVDPAKAVFIDDSAKNVEGAIAQGMHGIRFLSPMQVREDLADLLNR
ncbi:MAG: HAD family phosphatase [Bacteroidetes bacterium]|nr:HAD family phosphatase [Bacteroidota bacterium]